LRPQLFQLFKTLISPNIYCIGHSHPHFPTIAPVQRRPVIAVWPSELNGRIISSAIAPQ
jgi:hypothetical protein